MKKVIIVAAGVLLMTALSCQKEQTKVTENTATEVPAGKKEGIPDGEILKNYAAEAQQLLGSQLKQKIAEGGPENALEFCNINAIPLTDSISKKYKVTIKGFRINTGIPTMLPILQSSRSLQPIKPCLLPVKCLKAS
ncbi:MAG: hypothetical protein I8H68_08115 [Flavobacteriia bacterium]|nr:hypothetical protein [Flavobacteriia bacterium]